MTNRSADLDHLLDQARADLPGASDDGIKATLFDVLAEFFDETSIWQETIPVSILPNTHAYSIAPSDGGLILRLIAVLDQNCIGQPAILRPDRATIVLQATYNSPATFTATVVKTVAFPTDKSNVPIIPAIILAAHGVTILHGLKGTMMGQTSKSYQNPALGKFHLAKFLDGKKCAATDAQRGYTHGGQAWGFPRNWAVSNQRSSISTAFPRA